MPGYAKGRAASIQRGGFAGSSPVPGAMRTKQEILSALKADMLAAGIPVRTDHLASLVQTAAIIHAIEKLKPVRK